MELLPIAESLKSKLDLTKWSLILDIFNVMSALSSRKYLVTESLPELYHKKS